MTNTTTESDARWSHQGAEKLKAEVAALETGLSDLEQRSRRSPLLVQKLGGYFGFGAAGKLEWARFKLNFKQEELDQFGKREMPEASAAERAAETSRKKMERMIAENPADLAPHIRRVYMALIDAGI
ncbi:MAG: hypothetical protein SF339_23895 [Blastocatellia bacterium]|nr:hypothetical protein [Blastocatellia bacterium]